MLVHGEPVDPGKKTFFILLCRKCFLFYDQAASEDAEASKWVCVAVRTLWQRRQGEG